MDKHQVLQFREAAIKDGWKHEPIYGGHEAEERATKLEKGKYKMLVYARPAEEWAPGRWSKDQYSVSIWGVDGLSIKPPEIYSMDAIKTAAKVCQYCGRTGKTVRISFAGRCCPECREKHVATAEPEGWAD